jgi:hypothetical protein
MHNYAFIFNYRKQRFYSQNVTFLQIIIKGINKQQTKNKLQMFSGIKNVVLNAIVGME